MVAENNSTQLSSWNIIQEIARDLVRTCVQSTPEKAGDEYVGKPDFISKPLSNGSHSMYVYMYVCMYASMTLIVFNY